MPEITWDGRVDSYIPPETLRIDPSLALHQEAADQLDPITYEVIRHALWNVNEEHGITLEKVSGSPFAHEAHDFNSMLLSEDAEHVFFGPYLQLFGGVMDLPIKWTLENLSRSPGIDDGDMFLSNDPWIGSMHQMDVQVTCPVFWDGRLFCWVANSLHQYDIGGPTPGSFGPAARDVFEEPVPIPPIKIVESGEIRPDLERMYTRRSRQPELLALDLRAQISGNSVARRRILELLERYGAPTCKAVMRRIIENGERAFLQRMRRLPDSVSRHRGFVESALPGDRTLYQLQLTVTKEGDKLIFENEGTDEQAGALNATYSGWRAAMLSIVSPLFCFDSLYAIGGALRHLEFRPTPGTLNCPHFPASVTNDHITTLMACALANVCLGKTVASDPELKREVFSVCGGSVFPLSSISGIDQWGNEFGTGFLDPMGGAIGAFSFRDGVDTGGVHYEPKCLMPNVEQHEQAFPLLYLYRRELADSGGAGKFRGGNSAMLAVIPHGTDAIEHSLSVSGCAVVTAMGLSGGHPACPNHLALKLDTDVLTRFAAKSVPQDANELSGDDLPIDPRAQGFLQRPSDVWELGWSAGAGYGDPLERDPEVVATDVSEGTVSAAAAKDVYGVVLALEDGVYRADLEATDEERRTRREHRLRTLRPWRPRGASASAADEAAWHPERAEAVTDGDDERITEYLRLTGEADERGLACSRCGHGLGSVGENYKLNCLLDEVPAAEANVHGGDPSRYIDVDVVFRRFCCPGCGGTIETELARPDDEPLWDIQIMAKAMVGA